ncbi:MAG: 4Fe-4S dicluster domain-containing protein [Bacillota bacterium]|nr:MAG: 4Fe-4S dicluster domain-containing protein [Bacillota bacterium]
MKPLRLDRSLCVGCRLCEIVCSMRDEGTVNPKRARIRVPASFPLPAPPIFCRMCPRPKCAEACPTGALDAKDIRVLDRSKCDLCGACVKACPFEAIWKSPQEDVVLKCDLCGGDPLCAPHCPTGALSW